MRKKNPKKKFVIRIYIGLGVKRSIAQIPRRRHTSINYIFLLFLLPITTVIYGFCESNDPRRATSYEKRRWGWARQWNHCYISRQIGFRRQKFLDSKQTLNDSWNKIPFGKQFKFLHQNDRIPTIPDWLIDHILDQKQLRFWRLKICAFEADADWFKGQTLQWKTN